MTYTNPLECISALNTELSVPDQQLIQSCIRFQCCHIEYIEWIRRHIVDAVGDQPIATYANDLELSWERALHRIENLVSLTRLGATYKLDAARMYAAWASPGDGRATDLLAQAYAELHTFSSIPRLRSPAVATPPKSSNGVALRAD